MRVLNPIYDTVFKYLMEDLEIAKGLISVIIEQEVSELTPAPQEQTAMRLKIKYAQLELQHLDYVATIKTIDTDGSERYERVMVEVQKSPFTPEISRFRKYLAEKYKTFSLLKTDKGVEQKYLPIKTIYLIEETFNDALPSVLKCNRQYIDVLYKNEYTGDRDEFVDLLTHEAYFIQLNKVPKELFNKITYILSLFTPWYRDKDERYLNFPVEDNDFDKIKDRLLRRMLFKLYGAAGDDQLKLSLELEIEYEDYYEKQLTLLEEKDKENEKQLALLEEKNKENEKQLALLEEKDKENEKQLALLEEKDKEIEAKDKKLAEMEQMIEKLKNRV